MDTIYIDIETLPTDRADVIEMLAASIKAPGQYKKPESIAQWLEENKASELEELTRKTALDGAFGRVYCVGIADTEGPPHVYTGDELTVLIDLASYMARIKSDKYQVQFVGHNIAGFDLRFLLQRYIVNNIKPPPAIRYAAQAKPWEAEKVYDTMTQWAGVGNKISLDRLCMALHVPSPKEELDGSQVYDYWKAGRHDEIADYCKRDVEATRHVHKLMTLR